MLQLRLDSEGRRPESGVDTISKFVFGEFDILLTVYHYVSQ
jgi:hypothetical protein